MPTAIPVDRFPTQDEIDQEFARQQAEEAMRWRRHREGHRAPNLTPTDAEAELADLQPKVTIPYCPDCGKQFPYKSAGMATMKLNAHRRKFHAEQVEAI